MGKDLFGSEYDKIRNRLRTHGITTTLRAQARKLKQIIDDHPQLIEDFGSSVQNETASKSSIELIPTISVDGLILWILDGKNQGGGCGLPFDRPHRVFTQRLCSAYAPLQEIKMMQLRGQWRGNRPLCKLSCGLEGLVCDKILRRTLTEIEPKREVFDQLRPEGVESLKSPKATCHPWDTDPATHEGG